MSRAPFDAFVKGLAVDVLSPLGSAETDVRVAPDPQFADLCFAPRAPSEARDGALLERLTSEGLTMLEFARQPPDVLEMGTWLGKHVAWWRTLAAEARRKKVERVKEAPLFWGLSTGLPREALAYFRMMPMEPSRWLRGCYEGSPGGRFRLVVIAELPRVRETLVVRLMGAGETFRAALADLAALPEDAPEHALVWPHLARLRQETENAHDLEERAMLMDNGMTYAQWVVMQRQIGREQGLRPLERLFERRLARPLTAEEHASLVARLDTVGPDRLGDVVLDLPPAALAAWLADPVAR